MNFSDYIVYVDESGDHGMGKMDPCYPIFVLTFCVFKKDHYCNVVLPTMSRFKMKYWGHNNIILHEADMRRPRKKQDYFLNNAQIKSSFMADLSNIMHSIEFFYITTIIDKTKLKGHVHQDSIYEFSLLFCMERLHKQLQISEIGKTVDIFIEKRGNNEDRELELEFLKILSGRQQTFNTHTRFNDITYNFNLEHKAKNITGMQIADLIARPMGINYLRPHQHNQAYGIIANKNSLYALRKALQMIKIYPT